MTTNQLHQAAEVLDTLAAGRVPDRAAVLTAALALDTYRRTVESPSRDVLDAAAGLEDLATGGTLDLDETGRQRAAKLAEVVRSIKPRLEASPQPMLSGAEAAQLRQSSQEALSDFRRQIAQRRNAPQSGQSPGRDPDSQPSSGEG
jgi:hypothetical protein